MTLNNVLPHLSTMSLVRSTATPIRRTHYPAFTTSGVLDHNNLTTDSLLSPFRTPLPCHLYPVLCSTPPPRPLSPPHSVISILCCFPAHSGHTVVLADWSLRNLPLPVIRLYCGGRDRTHLSPLSPSPSPSPSPFAFSSIESTMSFVFQHKWKGSMRRRGGIAT